MKLLVMSNMYPSLKDPVYGTFVQNFVEEMQQRGVSVTLSVLRGRDGNMWRKSLKYVIFYTKSFFIPIFKKYDLIYVHCITYSTIPMRLLSYFKHLPLVFNVHGGDVLTRSQFAERLKQFNRPIFAIAKLFVVPSYFFAEVVHRVFPEISTDKIFVSPSGGVDTDKFSPKEGILSNQIFTIGYVEVVLMTEKDGIYSCKH